MANPEECVVLVELCLGSKDLGNCSVFSKYSSQFCVLDTTQICAVINVPTPPAVQRGGIQSTWQSNTPLLALPSPFDKLHCH